MDITSHQCRAARALIGWSQDKLAMESNVAKATIANFETGKREPYGRTLDDIRQALEDAGVEFTNGGQPGVRLKGLYRFQIWEHEKPEKVAHFATKAEAVAAARAWLHDAQASQAVTFSHRKDFWWTERDPFCARLSGGALGNSVNEINLELGIPLEQE
jgi:transcriptional regulator with XRE-family HTH domain